MGVEWSIVSLERRDTYELGRGGWPELFAAGRQPTAAEVAAEILSFVDDAFYAAEVAAEVIAFLDGAGEVRLVDDCGGGDDYDGFPQVGSRYREAPRRVVN